MNTKMGWQLLEDPPESYLIHTYGSRGIKIVGNTKSLQQLKDRPEPVKSGRCVELEEQVMHAQTRNDISEIPALSEKVADQIAAIAAAVGDPSVWYEIPPIMPAASAWTVAWTIAMLRALRKRNIRSVAFGFATGYPQVKPFDSAQSPDEWPILYPVLEVMDEIGIGWTRLGVEEYIVNNTFNPVDKSNVCRLDYVYEYHILPHGWTILAFVIELGFDLPGMRLIKGMTPDRALGTVDQPGLAAVDAEYAKRPYIDTAFLYAVVDPTRSNERDFAFTPGDKNAPIGYLEKFEGYFGVNPPAGPIVEVPPQDPPTDPPTPPDPVVGINLIKNASFEGPTRFYPEDRFGDRKVPEFWDIDWNRRQAAPHIEADQDPPRVYADTTAIRLWADERWQAWAYQKVHIEAGATYTFEAYAVGTRLPGIVGDPWAALAIDPNTGTDFAQASVKVSEKVDKTFKRLSLTFTPSVSGDVTLFVSGRTGNDGRGDVWFDAVSFTQIELAPEPSPDKIVRAQVLYDGTRVRKGPDTTHPILWQENENEVVLVYAKFTDNGWAQLTPRHDYPQAYIRGDLLKIL